jgi:hypothetical protein
MKKTGPVPWYDTQTWEQSLSYSPDQLCHPQNNGRLRAHPIQSKLSPTLPRSPGRLAHHPCAQLAQTSEFNVLFDSPSYTDFLIVTQDIPPLSYPEGPSTDNFPRNPPLLPLAFTHPRWCHFHQPREHLHSRVSSKATSNSLSNPRTCRKSHPRDGTMHPASASQREPRLCLRTKPSAGAWQFPLFSLAPSTQPLPLTLHTDATRP